MRKKYVGCNLSLRLFSWGIVFLRTICPRRNYVGHKSSEKHFSFRKVSRGILSGDKYLWGSCSGAIIWGHSFRGQLSGGQFFLGAINLRGQSSGGKFSSGAIILGGNCPGGNNLEGGGSHPEGQFLGGNYLGFNFNRGQLSKHLSLWQLNEIFQIMLKEA